MPENSPHPNVQENVKLLCLISFLNMIDSTSLQETDVQSCQVPHCSIEACVDKDGIVSVFDGDNCLELGIDYKKSPASRFDTAKIFDLIQPPL